MDVWFASNGDCPFCARTAQAQHIRESVGHCIWLMPGATPRIR